MSEEKDTMRSILASFCQWLENRGYLDDDWWCEEPKAVDRFLAENPRMEKTIKELRTRVAELEKENTKMLFDVSAQSSAERRDFARKYQELQNRLSTLLKASEGMEKALVSMLEHAEELRIVEETRLGEKRAKSNQCGYYEEIVEAKQALADFRAVKEGK